MSSGDGEVRGTLQPGARIAHYQVVRTVARGGMGVVYEARDIRLGRIVALKLVGAQADDHPAAERQLMEEARATAQLTHPNIVTLYDVGLEGDQVYLALEYVEGRSLGDALRERQLDLDEVLRLMRGVARAMEAAHARGVAHLDLKPGNILIGADGRVRVVDFGIARMTRPAVVDEDAVPLDEAEHEPRQGFGTPRFMAPEQWTDQGGVAADIWAFGLVLHFAVTRVHVLPRDTERALEIALSPARLALPDTGDALTDEVRELIRRCLAKAPAQRPSAAEVVEWLERRQGADRPPLASEMCPYPGPRPFDEGEAAFFAGVEDLVDAAMERLGTTGLLVVSGPSGVGKTSLVRAGVIPRLARSTPTSTLDVRAAARPFEAFVAALAEACGGVGTGQPTRSATASADEPMFDRLAAASEVELLEIAAELRALPTRLAATLHEVAERLGHRLVVFVDDVELLSGPDVDVATARAFLSALASAGGAREPVKTVCVVRDDVLGRMPWGEALPRALASTMVLQAPTTRALVEMVVEPLRRVGYTLEDPEAAERLARAVLGAPGALALLQFALREMWSHRDVPRRSIPRLVTDRASDPAQVLSSHADAAVDALEDRDVSLCRQLLLRLVTDERTLAAASRAELVDGLGRRALVLIDRLLDAGVLELDAAGRVSLATEALLYAWSRLSRWLDESEVAFVRLRELESRAQRWEAGGRSEALLLRGDELRDGERATAALPHRLSPEAAELVQRSSLRRRAEERARAWRRVGFASAAAIVAVAALISLWALRERKTVEQRARRRAEEDRVRLLATGARGHAERGDLRTARAMARAALESADNLSVRALVDELRDRPLRYALTFGALGYDVVLDEDAQTAFVASQSGRVLRLELATGALTTLAQHSDQVLALARLPGGDMVSVDWAGEVRRSDASGSRVVARLPSGPSARALRALGGDRALVARPRGRPLAIDLANGRTREFGPPLEGTGAIATTPEGSVWIGTTDGRLLRLGSDGERVLEEIATDLTPRAIDVEPLGGTLGFVSTEGVVSLLRAGARNVERRWQLEPGCRFLRWVDQDRLLAGCGVHLHLLDVRRGLDLAADPDPHLLTSAAVGGGYAVIAGGGGVSVLDRARLDRLQRSEPPSRPGLAVAAAPAHDRAFLATPGALHAFELSSGRHLRRLRLDGEDSRDILVDGELLYVTHGSYVSRLRLPRLHRTRLFVTSAPSIHGLALRDGRLLASGADGRIHAWSTDTGLAGPVTRAADGRALDLQVLSDGSWVAAVERRVLRLADGEVSVVAQAPSPILSLTVDPRDETLLVGDLDGGVRRVDPRVGESSLVYEVGARVYDIAVHTGRVATASADGVVRVLAPDGSVTELRGHRGEVNAVAFTPDGRHLLSGSDDATLRLWSLETGEPAWVARAGGPTSSGEDGAGCAHRDGELRLLEGGRPLARSPMPRPREALELPWGCAALGEAGTLTVLRPDGTVVVAEERASAMTRSEGRLVYATADALVSRDARGRSHRTSARFSAPVTVILVARGETWTGHADGEVTRFDGGSPTTLHDPPLAEVTHLAAGPAGTLVVGFASGEIGLWDAERNERLRRARLHGPVAAARVQDARLHAFSALGDEVDLDVSSLLQGRCHALRSLWRESPLVWGDGALVARPPAADHECAAP